jgi:hypothetical protein
MIMRSVAARLAVCVLWCAATGAVFLLMDLYL